MKTITPLSSSMLRLLVSISVMAWFLYACSGRGSLRVEEQIRLRGSEEPVADTTSANTVRGDLTLNEISTYPQKVVLTGLDDHRLVTVYKSPAEGKGKARSSYSYYYDEDTETVEHFMPGIDLVYGYNLVNVGHYDMQSDKLNFLFSGPVLVKSLYYPSLVQDSVDKKPINRDYYLVSVYDTDTNGDTLITKRDLRRFYHFDASGTKKIQVVPSDYSVTRSQYDVKNDVMFVFARHDTNHNGLIDKPEPLHIFRLDLKSPSEAKRLY